MSAHAQGASVAPVDPAFVAAMARSAALLPRGGSPWPGKDEQLVRLWLAGVGTREIAATLGLGPGGKNAVVGRVGRLGLPRRESPIKSHEGRVGRYPDSGAKVVAIARSTTRDPRSERERRIQAPTRRETSPTPLSTTSRCQWPMWSHGERPRSPVFCDAPAIEGRSWCPACLPKVFEKRRASP